MTVCLIDDCEKDEEGAADCAIFWLPLNSMYRTEVLLSSKYTLSTSNSGTQLSWS